MAEIEVHPLDAARVGDFFAVHCEANGLGWCACVAWEVPTWEGWGERTAEENVALRRRLFTEGHFHGYVLYEDGQPVGWCQCGPRDRWPKLVESFGLAPSPGTWAVTCFALAPGARKRGLAHQLLAGALDDLRRRGVRRVEAFPRMGGTSGGAASPPTEQGKHEDGEVWTGPESLFVKAGFAPVGPASGGKSRGVMAKEL